MLSARMLFDSALYVSAIDAVQEQGEARLKEFLDHSEKLRKAPKQNSAIQAAQNSIIAYASLVERFYSTQEWMRCPHVGDSGSCGKQGTPIYSGYCQACLLDFSFTVYRMRIVLT